MGIRVHEVGLECYVRALIPILDLTIPPAQLNTAHRRKSHVFAEIANRSW